MNRAEKSQAIEDFKESIQKAKGMYLTDFRGLTVAEITSLRFELKKASTDLKVVKNRLALRALEGGKYDHLKPHFDYMTAVAISYGDIVSSAKALTEAAKTNEKIKLRAAFVEGKVISLADVKALAKLPSKQELLGRFVGVLHAVPTGFVRVLAGVPQKWVYLLQAMKQRKEGS